MPSYAYIVASTVVPCICSLQTTYQYLLQNNAESWSLSFNSLEEQNASKTTLIQILSRLS